MNTSTKTAEETALRTGAAITVVGDAASVGSDAGSIHHAETERWELRLYIAGQTPKSVTAFANLQRLCEEHLPGRYQIEVIDLMEHPQLAAGDQIVAIPTLVRRLPEPLRRIVGDLSNTERTLVGLQLRPATPGK